MNTATGSDEKTQKEEFLAAQQLKAGANWFYWIAGLSVVNSAVALAGGQFYFVVGLGLNHLVNGIVLAFSEGDPSQAHAFIKLIAFILDALIAGVVGLFGFFANKRQKWAFVTGMVVYALDGLLFLMVGDFLSIAFHAFALYSVYRGLVGLQNLNKLQARSILAQSGTGEPIQ
jgi:hypothetical protein